MIAVITWAIVWILIALVVYIITEETK